MAKQNKKLVNFALIIILVAVGIHIYLAKHYFGLKYGTITDGPSLCNVNEILNCDTVTASKYSTLFGIPIAIWGAITNFALFILLSISRFNLSEDEGKAQRYPFYLSAFIAIVSIIMGSISTGLIKAFCLFCMINYGLSFITFGLLFAAFKNKNHFFSDFKDLFSKNRGTLGILVSIPLTAYIANGMALDSMGMGQIEKIAKEKVAYWNVAPTQKFDLTTGLVMQKGSAEPTMTIVEFADFKCPHCKHAVPSIHNFIKSHPDVKLIFKPFPLDGLCNSVITGGDGSRCKLAYATICAEQLSQKGWEMHDYIFEQQENFFSIVDPTENVVEYATKLQIPADSFKACMTNPDTQKAISAMAQEGVTAQVQGTPTFFVNGRLLNGAQLLPILEAAYQSSTGK